MTQEIGENVWNKPSFNFSNLRLLQVCKNSRSLKNNKKYL